MSEREAVYMDYAATTPLDERVFQAMLPYFSQQFGNPSSVHRWGQAAEAALEDAREAVANALGAQHTDEIVFTSGGSESDNLALRGVAWAQRKEGKTHLLISPVEHHAVEHTAQQLAQAQGFELEFLPVDGDGRVSAQAVADRIRPQTALVSVIYANNEIGSLNPMAEIGAVCRERGVPLHSDAVQAAGLLPMDVQRDGVSLLSIGAHKFYGPKGVGALYVKRGTPLLPTQTGGGQENGLRAGTQNIPYIVGMAEALKWAQAERSAHSQRLIALRDRLIGQVLEEIPHARLTGHLTERLPNHASFVFQGVDGNWLLTQLDAAGFACSSGSACKTGSPQPSGVLLALGLSPEWSLGSLRVTLGHASTPEQVAAFLSTLPLAVAQARGARRRLL